MESNKDEAERCIKISISALSKNQTDRAKRFLEKAQRLFPTDQAKSTLIIYFYACSISCQLVVGQSTLRTKYANF